MTFFPQVTGTGDTAIIKLCPLQMFARDVRTLLRTYQGKLALNQFEAAYAQHFGVALVAASYGYPSTLALLQAISHVAVVRGKGYRSTVLLCQEFHGKTSRVYARGDGDRIFNQIKCYVR